MEALGLYEVWESLEFQCMGSTRAGLAQLRTPGFAKADWSGTFRTKRNKNLCQG
jgi:hypothetical protein